MFAQDDPGVAPPETRPRAPHRALLSVVLCRVFNFSPSVAVDRGSLHGDRNLRASRSIAGEVAALCARTVPECAEVEAVLQCLDRFKSASESRLRGRSTPKESDPSHRDEYFHRRVSGPHRTEKNRGGSGASPILSVYAML